MHAAPRAGACRARRRHAASGGACLPHRRARPEVHHRQGPGETEPALPDAVGRHLLDGETRRPQDVAQLVIGDQVDVVVHRCLVKLVHRARGERKEARPEIAPARCETEDVRRGDQQPATRRQDAPALADEGELVLEVLDALEARDDVEAPIVVWQGAREIGVADRHLGHAELFGKEIARLDGEAEAVQPERERPTAGGHLEHA